MKNMVKTKEIKEQIEALKEKFEKEIVPMVNDLPEGTQKQMFQYGVENFEKKFDKLLTPSIKLDKESRDKLKAFRDELIKEQQTKSAFSPLPSDSTISSSKKKHGKNEQ